MFCIYFLNRLKKYLPKFIRIECNTNHILIPCRYADHPSLVAIELMNEPKAPDLKLDSLKRYYKAGYDTVRKYSSSAYVILSNRLGGEWSELLSFASNLSRVVIDVHFYNLFWENFNKMSVQQNIDYIYRQRSSDLRNVTTSDGPLSFVGKSASFMLLLALQSELRRRTVTSCLTKVCLHIISK